MNVGKKINSHVLARASTMSLVAALENVVVEREWKFFQKKLRTPTATIPSNSKSSWVDRRTP